MPRAIARPLSPAMFAGLLQSRRNRASGTIVSVYNTDEAGLDGGSYSTVCEEHGAICTHDTLKLARWHASMPDWCEICQRFMRIKGII